MVGDIVLFFSNPSRRLLTSLPLRKITSLTSEPRKGQIFLLSSRKFLLRHNVRKP